MGVGMALYGMAERKKFFIACREQQHQNRIFALGRFGSDFLFSSSTTILFVDWKTQDFKMLHSLKHRMNSNFRRYDFTMVISWPFYLSQYEWNFYLKKIPEYFIILVGKTTIRIKRFVFGIRNSRKITQPCLQIKYYYHLFNENNVTIYSSLLYLLGLRAR